MNEIRKQNNHTFAEVILEHDEDRARAKEWLEHCPKFIQKAYRKVRDIDWIVPCVVCSSKTSRLALVRESPLKTRTVAYVCGDCISHPRFVRIRNAPLRVENRDESGNSALQVETEEPTPSLCPTVVLRLCGMR